MMTTQSPGYTVGAIAPSNPQPGDRWHELSPLGFSLYGWDWIWSDGRWVSPEQFWNVSVFALVNVQNHFLDLDLRLIRLLEFRSRLFHAAAQTASNHWKIELHLLDNAYVRFQAAQLSTEGNVISRFTEESIQQASFWDFGAANRNANTNLFEILFTPIGSPGGVWGTARLKYHFVRP